MLGNNDLAEGIETGAWLDRLPIEERGEVIRDAVSHIVKGSKIFELTQHGGDYQEYFLNHNGGKSVRAPTHYSPLRQ